MEGIKLTLFMLVPKVFSMNDCKKAPFENKCSIIMMCLEGTWQDFAYIYSMRTLPDINSVMTFSTKECFVAGQNNPTNQVATFIACNVRLFVMM